MENQTESSKISKLMFGFEDDDLNGTQMSEKAENKLKEAKLQHRTDLKLEDWSRYEYYKNPFCDDLLMSPPQETITRIKYKDLDEDAFRTLYESKNIPVMIENFYDESQERNFWTFETIYKRFKDCKFKVGEDDKGKNIRVKLKYFYEYMIHQKEDSPLYLFEPDLEDDDEFIPLIQNYRVPKYFKEDDFFKILGEEKRPPYRWFLIGPKRSGTGLHIDPIGTSAWNLNLQGHKRWVLFPNDIPKSVVKGTEFKKNSDDDEAMRYFEHILPKIKEKEGKYLKSIEFTQNPGDLVFIPGGWWHAVVNLDNTMAVTQNFMSRCNFDKVWRSFRKGRKKLSCVFLQKLQNMMPEYYDRAVRLNKEDNFIMFDERITLENGKEIIQKKVKTENYVPSSSSSSPTDSSSDSGTSSD